MRTSPQTLTDQVSQILMQRISAGVYPVGSKLPSGRLLAGEFDVSAAVIREATERLRTKGLIKSRQGAGCEVLSRAGNDGFQMSVPTPDNKHALRHIYELRFDIEGGAAALAALRAGKSDIASMERILAALKKVLRTPKPALEWDLKFHQAMAAATHNPHYKGLLEYLAGIWRESVQAARSHTLAMEADTTSLIEQVHEEHVALLRAIKSRDPAAARSAAQQHLRNASERLGLDTSSFQIQP